MSEERQFTQEQSQAMYAFIEGCFNLVEQDLHSLECIQARAKELLQALDSAPAVTEDTYPYTTLTPQPAKHGDGVDLVSETGQVVYRNMPAGESSEGKRYVFIIENAEPGVMDLTTLHFIRFAPQVGTFLERCRQAKAEAARLNESATDE